MSALALWCVLSLIVGLVLGRALSRTDDVIDQWSRYRGIEHLREESAKPLDNAAIVREIGVPRPAPPGKVRR